MGLVLVEVVMIELPYTVTTKRLGAEAEVWCQEQFGERWFAIGRKTGNWTCFWAGRDDFKHFKWHFRYEKDALFFSLRWA